MAEKPRILAFAGSARKDSYNKKLVRIAASAAEAAGAEVTLIDLLDFPLPIFNEDLEYEEGTPEHATRLKGLMVSSHGLLIASPEYNSSISALLKNIIDWASRPVPGEPRLVAFQGKVVTLMSASPGGLGGLQGLAHVRSILGNIGAIVLPNQVATPLAYQAFQEDGSLKDPKQQESVKTLGQGLSEFLIRLKS